MKIGAPLLPRRQLCHRSGQNGVGSRQGLVQSLCHQVHLFLAECNARNRHNVSAVAVEGLPGYRPRRARSAEGDDRASSSSSIPEEILLQQRSLMRSCDRLKMATLAQNTPAEAVDVVTKLGALFTGLVELMLSREIKSTVDHLNRCCSSQSSSSSAKELRRSIDSVTTLALEGNHVRKIHFFVNRAKF